MDGTMTSRLVVPSTQLSLRISDGFKPESRAMTTVIPSAPSTVSSR